MSTYDITWFVIQIFQTYLLPIFTYCGPIWINDVKSQNAVQQLNSVFTNYMKRYLGLPKYAHNSAVHFYCGTWPLYNAVRHLASEAVWKIHFPEHCLENYQLSIVNVEPLQPFVPELELEPDFPRTRFHISRNQVYRKSKFRDVFNINHYKVCNIEKFHTRITSQCKCVHCGQTLIRGHVCPDVWCQ